MQIKMVLEKFLSLYNSITQEDIDKNYKGLDYISWANAYRMLLEQDIDAVYDKDLSDTFIKIIEKVVCLIG